MKDVTERLRELANECEMKILVSDTLHEQLFLQGKQTAYLELQIELLNLEIKG